MSGGGVQFSRRIAGGEGDHRRSLKPAADFREIQLPPFGVSPGEIKLLNLQRFLMQRCKAGDEL